VKEVVVAAEAMATSDQPAVKRLVQLIGNTMELYERHYPYMYLYIQEDMRKLPGDGTNPGTELEALSA
jgi:TetR/AcrR family transcriptional regulator, cholesterol catabolism regulator